MRNHTLPTLAVLALAVPATAHAAGLGPDWQTAGGRWSWEREIVQRVHQAEPKGACAAFGTKHTGAVGAWRATVQPSIGAKEAGIWILGEPKAKRGFLLVLGGNPGVGGFTLKSADGKTLWDDKWAPWRVYHPYVVEAVVERGRVRAQLFEANGRTLVSQGPWVDVPTQATEAAGMLGLVTRDGIARFWGAELAPKPLSPIVADAPNKRRLAQGKDSPWSIVGPGNWMWKTGKRQVLRQYARVDRTKAVHRAVEGVHRSWECRLKVDRGAGGAGMYFQCDPTTERGLLAWLGGKYGDGSLMLYLMPLKALWAGPQGHWHYKTEYVLRAETRKGEARVQLLKADGTTVVQASKWVKVGEAADTPGHIGFHTWKGTAEFWGFSEATQAAKPTTTKPTPTAAALGGGWVAHGDGAWQWADKARTRLRQTGKPKQAVALNTTIAGIKGTWRCRVKAPAGTTAAGIAFQASRDLKQGFACLLTAKGVALDTLAGKTLWADPNAKWAPGADYVLQGEVMTDRVALKLFAADGKTPIASSPDIYVPDTNNTRTGHLGLLARGGPADFWGWELK